MVRVGVLVVVLFMSSELPPAISVSLYVILDLRQKTTVLDRPSLYLLSFASFSTPPSFFLIESVELDLR